MLSIITVERGQRQIDLNSTIGKSLIELAQDFHTHDYKLTSKTQITSLQYLFLFSIDILMKCLSTYINNPFIDAYSRNIASREILRDIWIIIDHLLLLYRVKQSLPEDCRADMLSNGTTKMPTFFGKFRINFSASSRIVSDDYVPVTPEKLVSLITNAEIRNKLQNVITGK